MNGFGIGKDARINRPGHKRDIEHRLVRHYQGSRPAIDVTRRHELLTLMEAEASRSDSTRIPGFEGTRHLGFAALLSSQVRFVSPIAWLLQAALAIAVALVAAFDTSGTLTALATTMAGAGMVLAEAPVLLTSKTHGVDELEYACPLDCRGVLLARMIILGCSGTLALSCVTLAVPMLSLASHLETIMHACVPYFVGCVGCLIAIRKASSSSALALACGWASLVIAASFALYLIEPSGYDAASTGIWAIAAATALAWMLREARLVLIHAGEGLDMTRHGRQSTNAA